MRQFALIVLLAVALCAVPRALAHATSGSAHEDPDQRDPRLSASVGTALIAGIVTSDADRAPLRRVIVTVSGATGKGRVQAVTDDAGRFAFADLPSGRYTLTAEKAGWLTTYYGSRLVARGPGTPIAVAEGQRVTGLALSLLRGAVIAGTVRDENGLPLASAQVQVLLQTIVGGERRLVDPPGQVQRATTDERGRYRIYGLPPGEYTVRAFGSSGMTGSEIRATATGDIDAAMRELRSGVPGVPGGGPAGSAQAAASPSPSVTRTGAYFPGSIDPAGAQFLTLAVGEERMGIDVRNPLVRAATVEGMMVGPSGRPLTSVSVGIANASAGSLFASPGIVHPDQTGHFVMRALPPARYLFFGRATDAPAGQPSDPVWTSFEVTVNEQDVTGVVMPFLPGATVSGRLAFSGTRPPPLLTALRVQLTPLPSIAGASLNVAPVVVRPDGGFSFTGLGPGRYGVAVSGNGEWTLRSAVVNGRDALDTPLEVAAGQTVGDLNLVFTDTPTEITGTLVDQLGRPAPEYTVVVFSTDRSRWLSPFARSARAVRLASDGTFRVSGLPPGEYYLAAVTAVDPIQLLDAAFLEQLATAALKLTLAEGEKKTQNLRIGGSQHLGIY